MGLVADQIYWYYCVHSRSQLQKDFFNNKDMILKKKKKNPMQHVSFFKRTFADEVMFLFMESIYIKS